MGPLALKQEERFTYGDYVTWDDDERWELIDGVPYNMSPAPRVRHQAISRELLAEFVLYLRGKSCQVFAAPFDVRLPESDERDDLVETVVQPDLSVICDRGKLDDAGCRGAPDLIVEILSPGTAHKDLKVKFDFLKADQACELLRRHCEQLSLPMPSADQDARLRQLPTLTPGDFAAVVRQSRFRPLVSPAALVDALVAECAVKEGAKAGIGFLQ